jgi:hypothetical protein
VGVEGLSAEFALMSRAAHGLIVPFPGCPNGTTQRAGPGANPNPDASMTDTATEPVSPTTNDAWSQQLATLKVRYKHAREPVLAALNILMHEPNISLEDAKARARERGVRITAASVNAARTLRERLDSLPPLPATNGAPESRKPRATRRARDRDKAGDSEALIRGFVAKLQGQGNAEADRLRDAMRKALAVLQAAVGDR